jgi:hypothetical protein
LINETILDAQLGQRFVKRHVFHLGTDAPWLQASMFGNFSLYLGSLLIALHGFINVIDGCQQPWPAAPRNGDSEHGAMALLAIMSSTLIV